MRTRISDFVNYLVNVYGIETLVNDDEWDRAIELYNEKTDRTAYIIVGIDRHTISAEVANIICVRLGVAFNAEEMGFI
jgi:hypothetical protein